MHAVQEADTCFDTAATAQKLPPFLPFCIYLEPLEHQPSYSPSLISLVTMIRQLIKQLINQLTFQLP